MNELLTIVATAATTLLIAVVAAVLGARLQASREQVNWLRDRRYEVCTTMLKSIDWHDLSQKVDAKRPEHLPAPADLYAELDILGMDAVAAAARRSTDALYQIEVTFQNEVDFDSAVYERLQAQFDATRASFVQEARSALGIKAI